MKIRTNYKLLCNWLLITMYVIAFLAVNVNAEPDPIIYEVSGITKENISISEMKKQITLFDAYALAVKNTESLPIRREGLRQAQARQYQAIGTVLPRLSLKGSVALTGDDSIASQSQRSSVSLYAKQSIITGLNELAAFKGSSHEVRIKRYELAHAAGVLLNDVALSFYQVIQLEKSINTNMQILDLYEKMIQELNRRVSMGKSRRSEVLMARSQMYKIKADVQAQQSSLKELRLGLKSLAGIPVDVKLSVGSDVPAPAYSMENIESIIEARWDIKAAREEIKLYFSEMLGAIGGHLPSAYLEGSYRVYEDSSSSEGEFYGGFGFEVPLFYGEVPGKAIEKASQKKQAQLRLLQSIRDAEYEIRDSCQSWQNTAGEIESYGSALTAAEENYQATIREYRLNLVPILDVLTALTSLQSARNDYETKILQNKFNRIRLGVATAEFPGPRPGILREALEGTDAGVINGPVEAGENREGAR